MPHLHNSVTQCVYSVCASQSLQRALQRSIILPCLRKYKCGRNFWNRCGWSYTWRLWPRADTLYVLQAWIIHKPTSPPVPPAVMWNDTIAGHHLFMTLTSIISPNFWVLEHDSLRSVNRLAYFAARGECVCVCTGGERDRQNDVSQLVSTTRRYLSEEEKKGINF